VTAGWTSKPIGDVFKVVNGGTPKTGVASNWDGPHAWITPAEMGNLDTPYISESRRTLTDEGLRTGAELVPAGSIILSSRAPIGHLIINEIPMAFNQGCKGLIPSPAIDTKYAYYFLLTNVPLLESLGTGATFKELSGGKLKEVGFQFPELGEQHRIVTLLDEAFADIATAKANAEKNLQNARGLFASRMQKLFDEDQSWERVQLEDLLSRGWIESHLDGNHGSDYPRKEEFVESGVPYIAARALRGWEVDFSEAKYLTHDRASTIRKGLAQDGDVLFAHNATVGPVGILKTNEPFVILGTSLTYYRCNENFILPEYLAHYMRSPTFVDQYSQVMKQSTRNQVPITKQREFFHIIPPLSIQHKIANDLDSLSEKIELLETIYRQKLTALDDLKKSLLHQAFSGQL
jgi:type I restriction enzyme, S subunit